MLTLNLDSPPDNITVLRASPEGKAVVSKEQTYSQLTLWLLAVRDHRDRAAFGEMFDHLAPRLKGFVIRCGARPALAEEIVQDVMLTIWRKAALFDPHKAQASAWIYQIARNRHIDIVRKESRPVPDELAEGPGAEPDASQILALEQEAEQLKQAIALLHPDQKDMIEKAYIGDLTHQEISSQTGLPLGTVKSRIRLGLGRLRKELKGLR
nr:sigma-70 family RNA polymerase sigma factor [Leisingera sp. HS039]